MAAARGLDVSRVAEILVDLGPGVPGRRGSGYRVSTQFVLTAAHVVLGASSVRVRFDADQQGEWSVTAQRVLELPEIDIALLAIQAAAELTPTLFGGVSERDAVIICSAVGFPLWKLREDERGLYRDSAHVTGSAAVLANRREGTLELSVPPPEPDPDPDVSPWEGMSGAAAFCNGRIVGIVSKHHRSDGLGRLAVSRADRWHSPELCDLLPGLGELVDVVPPSLADQVTAGYLAQVHDIAPDALMNRADELAELAAICAGPDRYQWWQGAPKSGKTALASWFVLHPPDGVRIASFFITSGLPGQSDSSAFTEAMIDQLAALAGEPAPPTSETARDGLRRHLLTKAAASLRERGERLVLVVDGLDQDTGNRPGSNWASIASLLPRRPPDGVRVLVTSREHPPLPADVPPEHPLRACRPRTLAASPHASESVQEAENELLHRLLAGDDDREILAFITAAGGGLTAAELSELTGSMQFEVIYRLGTVLGRSLTSRPRYEAEHERVFLFAHETLHAAAGKILRPDLARYRDKIHAWADKYRGLHWPPDTPGYLLRSYGRLLSDTGDLARLATLAAESTRHDRMLEVTRSDLAALTEITLAQDLQLASPVPDLSALLLLAAERHRLGDRTGAIPLELPAAWARLGNMRHALQLARSFADPALRATALAGIAMALTDEPDRVAEVAAEAEQVAYTAYAPAALRMVALAIASTDPDRALTLITEIAPDPGEHLDEYTALVQASADRFDIAERSASRITWNSQSAPILAQIASHFARSDPDRATRLADQAEQHARGDGIPSNPGYYLCTRIEAMASVASALAETDPARARLLADDALRACRLGEDAAAAWGGFLPGALSEVVVALAAVGRPDQAESAARTPLPEPHDRMNLLAAAAEALARSHPARAAYLAQEAEHMARGMSSWQEAANPVRAPLAEALVIARRPDLARQIADNAPYLGPRILAVIAGALVSSQPACSARLAAQAEQAARAVGSNQNGDASRARRARALAEVAQALADSHPQQAERLMTEAKQTVPRFALSKGMDTSALGAIVDAFAATGEWTDALRVLRSRPTMTREGWKIVSRGDLEARVAEKLTNAGEWDRAEAMARAMTWPDYKSQALADIAKALADSQRDRAALLLAEADEAAAEIHNDDLRRAVQLPIALARWSVSGPATDAERHIRRLLAEHLTAGGEPRLRMPLDHTDGLSWEILPIVGEVIPDAVVALHEWIFMQSA